MITKNLITVFVVVVLLVACSKTETPVNSPNSNSLPAVGGVNLAGQSPDYKLICERLTALAPEGRRISVSENCEAKYQKMLPSCQNASDVNSCYVNMKDWSERLACLDSCVRK